MIVEFTVYGADRAEIESRAVAVLNEFAGEARNEYPDAEVSVKPAVDVDGSTAPTLWQADIRAVI